MKKTTLEELVEDLDYRKQYLLDTKGKKVDRRNKAFALYSIPSRELIEITYGHVMTSVERRATLTQLVSSVGGCINRRMKLKLDEVTQVHLGWFIVIAYFETGILSYYTRHVKKGKRSKYPTYHIKVKDLDRLNSVVELVDEASVDLFPMSEPPADWGEGFLHSELGYPLIKHAHEDAIKAIKKEDIPYVKTALNKLQHTGWRINRPVYDIFLKCMCSEINPFKHNKEVDKEKRASLLIEVEAIRTLASRRLDKPFYHLYNLDFRGRIYPNTAFLHEQSSDNAKGLLIFDEPRRLGTNGIYWLSVHTANVWGEDSVSLDDRVEWVNNNIDAILLYASDPMKNVGWMKADKPFMFLACCFEFSMLSNWNGDGHNIEDFPSCLPIYIDGSNNGVQHLVAMSKDEVIAPLVNLVPQDAPGDVYMYIAEKTFKAVQREYDKLDNTLKEEFPKFHRQLVKHRQAVAKEEPGTERYKLAIKRLREFSNQNFDTKKKLGPAFWSRVIDPKIWRKTVKRPVMTLGYGGTQYGMVDMVHDDTYDLSDYLRDKDKAWSAYLGRLIYTTCFEELHGPSKMLKMFETLAIRENDNNRPIQFRQIITHFPFVHSYREGKTKRVELKYGDQRISLNVQVWREATLKKSKQKTGAAPNIVHSIDAVHVAMYIHGARYPVTVVHDSFGAHAGSMEQAFYDVRKTFVELYQKEPLEYILKQMDSLDLIPEKGKLDVRDVMSSDYAFA